MSQVERAFGDGFTATGCTADTAAYPVLGGRYNVIANGSFNGASASLEMLSPDGTNYITIKDINGNAVTFSTDGYATIDLAPGKIKFAIGSVTSLAVAVVPSPRRNA